MRNRNGGIHFVARDKLLERTSDGNCPQSAPRDTKSIQ